MEDRSDSDGESPMPRSNPKLVGGGEKRKSQQKDGLSRKRVKMRDLDSVISQEMNAPDSTSATPQLHMSGEDMSGVTDEPITSETVRKGAPFVKGNLSTQPPPLDINHEVCSPTNSPNRNGSKTSDGSSETLSLSPNKVPEGKCVNSRGYGVELNAEDVSSSVNHNRNSIDVKRGDVSECGSCAVSPKKKDPLKAWKEMKENGFLSSSHGLIFGKCSAVVSSSTSHGGIPVPKKRGRKTKNDNQKTEIAKKEQVDRFAKIAAPSGLLNGLNPGIINHVRNRKQVHSIIESLVKSEKLESLNSQTRKENQVVDGFRLLQSEERWQSNALSWEKQSRGCMFPGLKSCSSNPAEKCGQGDSSIIDQVNEDVTMAFKLSSSVNASENTIVSSLSNEDSSASSLCVKAASVASLWLELLQQDIKGRLTALRRSKKRVRAVIATEFPFLVSKEFSNQDTPIADMHRARWNALFDQMEKKLAEDEKELESWWYQVKDMQANCDQGLNHIHGSMLQHIGASVIGNIPGNKEGSEKELAVKAAAASIYSTCNFLSVKENDVSCF